MGPLEERITRKIQEQLSPTRFEVINESHLHAGHQGGAMDGTGETHFRVRVIAASFTGMSRVDRHRALNELLADELAGGVHALALEPAAPSENVRW
ncbi:BolA family protein [Oricola cellulosilytica]|uniref:BolA family transcriptional regulator n=1 Tax=Oricola cellulosilytica TaxID=1429082 RepID=A0A4R0P9Z7_9HYPH|nr:BolA family protein [Oricola cellulosilytica]TCD13745.1 BolA family transcriptional regulator [Oricola cellulosilytica]